MAKIVLVIQSQSNFYWLDGLLLFSIIKGLHCVCCELCCKTIDRRKGKVKEAQLSGFNTSLRHC